jgi:hypothetical protein
MLDLLRKVFFGVIILIGGFLITSGLYFWLLTVYVIIANVPSAFSHPDIIDLCLGASLLIIGAILGLFGCKFMHPHHHIRATLWLFGLFIFISTGIFIYVLLTANHYDYSDRLIPTIILVCISVGILIFGLLFKGKVVQVVNQHLNESPQPREPISVFEIFLCISGVALFISTYLNWFSYLNYTKLYSLTAWDLTVPHVVTDTTIVNAIIILEIVILWLICMRLLFRNRVSGYAIGIAILGSLAISIYILITMMNTPLVTYLGLHSTREALDFQEMHTNPELGVYLGLVFSALVFLNGLMILLRRKSTN